MAAETDDRPAAAPLAANEKFFRYFQQEVTDLQEQMTRIKNHSASGGERVDAIDHCLLAISRLSSEVQDASSYIPSHDKRTYGETIKALQSKLQEVRAAGLPRQKFSFKKSGPTITTRKNESAISLNDAAVLANQKRKQLLDPLLNKPDGSSYANMPADQLPAPSERANDEIEAEEGRTDLAQSTVEEPLSPGTVNTIRQPSSSSTSVSISNHGKTHIVLPTTASHTTSSGTVSNVKRCIIDMSSFTTHGQPFATLTLKNISLSLIICGHVNGAAHLTGIQDSVIVVASRQFRMHESSNCHVYLFATSRPIIEDCTSIYFAPLPKSYMKEADEALTNQWSNVDDFKWLRNEPSPHWNLVDVQKRIPEIVWKDTVAGGHGLSVDDILSAVEIPI